MTTATERTVPGWRLRRFEAALFAITLAVLTYQIVIPPAVGLADNGDYGWLMESLGLERGPEEYGERYWSYVNRYYRIGARQGIEFVTSEQLPAEVALALDRHVTRDRTFDLVFLGGVHLTLYLGGLYLVFLATATFAGPARWILGGGVALAATDFAWVSTFNSLYSESASLIFLVLLVGLTLVTLRRRRAPRGFVATFFALAALFLAAKPQNYPLVLPLMLLAPPLLARLETPARRRSLLAAMIGLLLLVALLFARLPIKKRSANLWNVVFCNILPRSPAPAEDLRKLGLDPEMVVWVGVNAWSSIPEPPYEEIGERLGFGRIGLFYARHPRRLAALAADCANGVFRWRDPLFGNYMRGAGRPPRARTSAFTHWSSFEHRVLPGSPAFLLLFFAAYFTICGWLVRNNGAVTMTGAAARLSLVLGLMAVLEFLIVVVGEGTIDLVRHLFLFQVLFDTCLLGALAWLAVGAHRLLVHVAYRDSSISS